MVSSDAGFQFLETRDDLREYILNLQDTTELRYPAVTSLNHTESLIMIPFSKKEKKVLLVPYNRLKAHTQEQTIALDVTESVHNMAYRGLLQEIGCRITGKVYRIFKPYFKKDSKGGTEQHIKHVAVITDFFHKISSVVSEKIGRPVWVHEDLLPEIFEKITIVERQKKRHPHYRAYLRFKMWRKGNLAHPNYSDGLDNLFK